jgi:tRNA-dihydrouridine synthase
MIGRAAMSNPWIFTEIKHALAGLTYTHPTLADRWDLVLRHAREEVARRGELHGMRGMRGRLMAYTRGLPGGRHLRGELSSVSTLAELEELGCRHLESAESDPLRYGGDPVEV